MNQPNIIIPNVGDKKVFGDGTEYVYTAENVDHLSAEYGLWQWLRHNKYDPMEMTITHFEKDSITINFKKSGNETN